jgi:hypothetical protein
MIKRIANWSFKLGIGIDSEKVDNLLIDPEFGELSIIIIIINVYIMQSCIYNSSEQSIGKISLTNQLIYSI